MRFWEWGQADAEFADWNSSTCSFATPFGPWGGTLESQEQIASYHAEENRDLGYAGVNQYVKEMLMRIKIDQIRAKLGQVPILIKVALNWTHDAGYSTNSGTMFVRRMLTIWDLADWDNFYYDKSNLLTWYQDRRHVVRGQDVEDTILHTADYSHVTDVFDTGQMLMTDLVSRALRDNIDIYALIGMDHEIGHLPTSRTIWVFNPDVVKSRRPYLSFAYVFPIEFYKDDGAGTLDLTSPIGDNPGEEYYLGSVEPGQTGTATKGHLRNFTGAIQQVEVFDDHPEYTTPITRVGTSQLDFVVLAEAAVSQRYTVIFYSATQYEVKAEAYRENAISLHPQIDADAQWRGAVGTNFVAPEGGLTIPSTAWQADTALDDEYEVSVQGNTTDTTWPADSNDQVEITKDNGGVADATAWRPIQGRREKTTAQVTIDATTKFIPTRRIDPTQWIVDTRAFIQSLSNINEGAISSVQEASIGTPTFSGTGNDDLTLSGNYNGTWTDTLRVEIDAVGTPDTFRWSIDGGSTWEASGVSCSTSPVELVDGIFVTFGATTGHVLNDYWDSSVESWGIELKSLTATSTVYNSGSIIGTTLPIRDVAAAIFTTVNADSGASQTYPARLYLTSTAGFSAGQNVFIQNPDDPDTAETREVDSVSTGYIDLTVSLAQDYSDGDFVTVIGTGQAAFWMRPVATETTVEQLKRLRINARIL